MKKLLLSGLLVASLFSAKAQTITGATDNFNTVKEVGDINGGVYWFKDDAYPDSYTLTRTGSALEIAVNKAAGEYSVIGIGFGDSNGEEAGGVPTTLDISENPIFSLNAVATEATTVDLQLEDLDGTKIELAAQNNAEGGAPKLTMYVGTTAETFTFDLEGARVVANWNCTPELYPADCPTVDTEADFDYTKVAKIVFLIAGGQEYVGTVTFDDFKIGGGAYVLSTTSAKGAISSSKLYPNPATESASIELSLKESSDVKVTLSDLMGREVAVIANENNVAVNKSFSTSNLAKGMYTVNYFINGSPAKAELLMVK
ncbi:T9SS type A sorting domain-containing protein [Sporocytophaga myxococcoides]|uniref:T9SS type A sorting domain-containing protein n=1 Tax=Sporocytophaga myxococcoides TaxID=153721 RepID=UPI000425F660|nr:T9SS type A sorting domain-containing protein [Sporocytophaga myxococcoides]